MISHQLKHENIGYRSDIDGLRAVAVMAVVAFHAFPNCLPGGFIGVDVFFVISGYLISTIIYKNVEKNSFNFGDFYSRRIKRIFPALLLILTVSFVVGWYELLPEEFGQLGKHIAAGSVFSSNFILWSESGYFDNAAETKPLLHLWSLGVEEQFYIVWPIIIWVSWRRKSLLLPLSAAILCTSLIVSLLAVKIDPVADFYSPITRFWELLSGSMLAFFQMHHKSVFSIGETVDARQQVACLGNENDQSRGKRANDLLSALGFALLAYGFFRINRGMDFPGVWALIPVSAATLIIAAGEKAFFNRILLSNQIAIWLGLISFPIYLWHWPLLSFAQIIAGGNPGSVVIIAAVVGSIVLAWLTYLLIERPIRYGKPNKKKVKVLAASMAIAGLIGSATFGLDGLPMRMKGMTNEQLPIRRAGLDSSLTSLAWYRGKQDWLFLGDSYNKTVSKLKLTFLPSEAETEAVKVQFSKIAEIGSQYNTRIVLLVAPNKSTIYPEYLPDNIVPSNKRYSSYFLDKLCCIDNLVVYNPADDLIRQKESAGLLYWMTDTHWNEKGAFVAYKGLLDRLKIPVPRVEFLPGTKGHKGDIIGIGNLKDFPLHAEDNWEVVLDNQSEITKKEMLFENKTTFGIPEVVLNQQPLSNLYVWVIGDSFSESLRKYFDATFKEVHYVGHWSAKLNRLPEDLASADRKPDLVVIERVERSF